MAPKSWLRTIHFQYKMFDGFSSQFLASKGWGLLANSCNYRETTGVEAGWKTKISVIINPPLLELVTFQIEPLAERGVL